MFFTQDDYKKIQQWLTKNSVKDTEFNEAVLPLNGNEEVTIIQGNHNKKLSLKDLANNINLLGASDFVNVSESFNAKYITLQYAISLIPYKSRKLGQLITFLDKDGNWNIYQFKGESLEVWSNVTLWIDVIESLYINSILPDEEDLTMTTPDIQGNTKLKLKDKEYNVNNFSGLGRVYLRKNIAIVEDAESGINKEINLLTQYMMSKPNTIYIIQYDYDLNGAEITIPEGCVLDFQGGSLSNGTIVGDISNINSYPTTIFYNIVVKGTWKVPNIYSEWFNFNHNEGFDNSVNLQNLCNLTTDDYIGSIYINSGDYYLSISENQGSGLFIHSNTTLNLKGRLILNNTNFTHYYIIRLKDKKNVTIDGGYIIGDVDAHEETGGEWGMGISIVNGNNITVKNVNISKCWGDGIYIGQVSTSIDNYAENVVIENVTCDDNRRQGLSLIAGKDIFVNNSRFINTGKTKFTQPGAGVDIEPNGRDSAILKNIKFDSCLIEGNTINDEYRGFMFTNTPEDMELLVTNCIINDGVYCYGSTEYITKGATFLSCFIRQIKCLAAAEFENVIFDSCVIGKSELYSQTLNTHKIILRNCSYLENAFDRNTITIQATKNTPISKIHFNNTKDCFIKFYVLSGWNSTNNKFITEYVYSIRNLGGKSAIKESAKIYRGTSLTEYASVGVVMSQIYMNEDGSWDVYLKPLHNNSSTTTLIIECYNNLWVHTDSIQNCRYFNITEEELPEDVDFSLPLINVMNAAPTSSLLANKIGSEVVSRGVAYKHNGLGWKGMGLDSTYLYIETKSATPVMKVTIPSITQGIYKITTITLHNITNVSCFVEYLYTYNQSAEVFYKKSAKLIESEANDNRLERYKYYGIKASQPYKNEDGSYSIFFMLQEGKYFTGEFYIEYIGRTAFVKPPLYGITTKAISLDDVPQDMDFKSVFEGNLTGSRSDIEEFAIAKNGSKIATEQNVIAFGYNGKWVKSDGSPAFAATKGIFSEKPTSDDGIAIGYSYFCTDRKTAEGTANGIMIYYKGNDVWVDALGRVVE